MTYRIIVHYINRSELGASAVRAALRLAEAIPMDSKDFTVFEWDHIRSLLGNGEKPLSGGRVRSLLIDLAQAGLFEYHTNSVVTVRFAPGLRAEFDQIRAESARICANNDHVKLDPRADSDHIRADSEQISNSARIRANNDHVKLDLRADSDHIRADSDQISNSARICADSDQIRADSDHTIVVSQSVSNSLSTDQPTDRRALALLTDPAIGMSEAEAQPFAGCDPDWLARQIFAWRRDRQNGKVDGLGALHHRLKEGWGAPELSSEERRTNFYLRHFGDPLPTQGYLSPRPAAPDPEPCTPEETVWRSVLADLERSLGSAIYASFVGDARLLHASESTWQIELPNGHARDWVSGRLTRPIRRALKASGYDVDLEFVVSEEE